MLKGIDKTVLYVIIGLIILSIVIGLTFFGPSKEDKDHERVVKSELDKLRARGITPNYPDIDYFEFANVLYNSMEGAGTDEDSVFRIIYKIRNEADWYKLVQAFGVRDGLSLTGWVQNDFSTSDIAKLNNELFKAGIGKKF